MPLGRPCDALLLVAHGSRDADWAEPFEAVAQRIRSQRPDLHVALAYLQLQAPSADEGAAALVALGSRSVLILPLFLGTGTHVRHDLSTLRQTWSQRWPAVEWELAPAIGAWPGFGGAVAGLVLAAPNLQSGHGR